MYNVDDIPVSFAGRGSCQLTAGDPIEQLDPRVCVTQKSPCVCRDRMYNVGNHPVPVGGDLAS